MPTCPTPLQTPIPSRTSFFCTLLEVGPFASPAVTHQRPADGRLRRFTLATPGGLERDRIVVEGHRADVVWTALVGVAVPTVAAVGRKDVDVGRLEGRVVSTVDVAVLEPGRPGFDIERCPSRRPW